MPAAISTIPATGTPHLRTFSSLTLNLINYYKRSKTNLLIILSTISGMSGLRQCRPSLRPYVQSSTMAALKLVGPMPLTYINFILPLSQKKEGITISPSTKQPKEKQPHPKETSTDKKKQPPPGKTPPQSDIQPIDLTPANVLSVKSSARGHFPFAYPSINAVLAHVKEMKAAGKSLADAEAKFTENYDFPSLLVVPHQAAKSTRVIS